MYNSILVINCGSTTIKFQLVDTKREAALVKGSVDRIGRPDCTAKVAYLYKDEPSAACALQNAGHREALEWVFNALPEELKPAAVGHRVVHGGSFFDRAVQIDEGVLEKIGACSPLAPLHNPIQLEGIRASLALHPEIPQFASFDTAFHQNKPELNSIVPLPQDLCAAYGYRKFGFHGESHRYVSRRAAQLLSRDIRDLRLITCHLGGGSSITAVHGGVAVDTSATYGTFTGLPMGSRSGDIDAGIILDLIMEKGKSAQEVYDILYRRSGLLGLSGISADMAELERLEAEGHQGAHLAREYYTYSLIKYIGAFAALMQGLDGLVFTAGIGEHDAALRERVCSKLAWIGLRLDAERNRKAQGETIISAGDSAVVALVIPTNEELAIALEVQELLGAT
ncbi:acetate/propionate family kinase [Gracilinema caldarium]|uniref:acetate/propionate family kinase n=1 Tax=Gracilinema caldarium TaxID=215591 RepID=UPI0026F102A2|nr:acetate/propionate family kinase [Gracilinema caldarium]